MTEFLCTCGLSFDDLKQLQRHQRHYFVDGKIPLEHRKVRTVSREEAARKNGRRHRRFYGYNGRRQSDV